MDLLNDWIPESLLYAMGWTLVHSLWQLVLIGAGLWLLLKLFRKNSPAFKYNLGLAAMGLTVLVALGTFIYEVSSFTPTPLFDRIAFIAAAPQAVQASSSLGIESVIAMSVNWIELQLPLLVNFWFVGALLFLFRLFNSLSEVRTLRRSSSEPQDFQLEKMLYRLMGEMNVSKNVEIRLTSYGVSPITFGFLKPIILIPSGLIFQLTPVQLEAIIAHELAHVKRNDYFINLIQSALEVLFFYHPCYWWMNQTVKELRENAADDLAVQVGVTPKELAYSLAEVLNFAKQNPPELALAAGKRRNPTLQRIKRILGHPAQTYPQNPIISIPMLLTLLLSAGLMATAQQDVSVSVEKTKPISVNVNPVIEVSKDSDVKLDVNSDVTVAVNAIVDNEATKVVVIDGKAEWINAKNEVIELNSANPQRIHIKGDTIIAKGDTIILKSGNKTTYTYTNKGKTLILEDVAGMDLSPMPEFPAQAMAPVMDFVMAPTPVMEFAMAPMMDFDMGEMPAMNFDMGTMPAMDFMISPPAFDVEWSSFSPKDTINMTKAEKQKWQKEMEMRAEEYSKKMENWEVAMKPKMEEYEAKMAEWQKNFEPKMEVYEQKMAEWQKAYEPKLKEFEKKMAEWQKANEPKMKEFEAKMDAWQKANEPKMKEYEAKMKAWEKEMQPKMEEYQRKMEVWQKENAAKIEEYQKKVEQELKKKEDNK